VVLPGWRRDHIVAIFGCLVFVPTRLRAVTQDTGCIRLREGVVKIDCYTRLVLTIIALCLVWISIRDIGAVHAAPDIMDVRIVGIHPQYTDEVTRFSEWQPLPIEGTRSGKAVTVHTDIDEPLSIKNYPDDPLWIHPPR
jgi:hypothetical protein